VRVKTNSLQARESQIQVVETPSAFDPRAQRNPFRHADAHRQRRVFVSGESSQQSLLLKQSEKFEDNHDDNNYSNYIEDVSVHAEG
jgi:hypothetical protein